MKHMRTPLAAIAVAAFALSACGGDDDNDTTDTTAVSADTTEDTVAEVTVADDTAAVTMVEESAAEEEAVADDELVAQARESLSSLGLDEEQIDCIIDNASDLSAATDTAAMTELFETCEIDLATLGQG